MARLTEKNPLDYRYGGPRAHVRRLLDGRNGHCAGGVCPAHHKAAVLSGV